MNWFRDFFKKNEEEFEIVHNEVPTSTLIRWYLHDMDVENSNEVASIFGLTPISDEGADKEMEDSDARLINIGGIIPFIEIMADINARVVAHIQSKSLNEDGEHMEQEAIDMLAEFYTAISISALVPAFASAIELGIIIPTTVNTSLDFREKNYE